MAVVATGFFDGVHLGHRRIIDELVSSARERGEESVVVTFAQHPRAVLQQDPKSLRLLSSKQEKIERLRDLGVDRVEVLQFTREFSSMDAGTYIRDILVGRFNASAVVLGYDNRFGADNLPTADIASLAAGMGLDVRVVPEYGTISSTKIRKALEEGRVGDASAMLGYDYGVSGIVVPGKQLGRTLGFPTANLSPADPLKQIPARGVYLTETEVMGRCFRSMTNVGDIVETNIFDFDEDIYSLEITVRFLKRIREMKKFLSLDELSEQLRRDRNLCMGM